MPGWLFSTCQARKRCHNQAQTVLSVGSAHAYSAPGQVWQARDAWQLHKPSCGHHQEAANRYIKAHDMQHNSLIRSPPAIFLRGIAVLAEDVIHRPIVHHELRMHPGDRKPLAALAPVLQMQHRAVHAGMPPTLVPLLLCSEAGVSGLDRG